MPHNPKVLVVATSRKTRGGITSVVKAHEAGVQWKQFHCHWVQTHRDGSNIRKIYYFICGLLDYIIKLPFYDIVHIHFSLAGSAKRKLPFVKIARLFRRRIIIHLHCGSQIDSIWNPTYDYLFRTADVSLLLSESLKQCVKSYVDKESDLQVLYNPCPIVSLDGHVNKENLILFSGTLYKGKGYQDLIAAFGLIAKDFPDWKVVFAGNGEIEVGKNLSKELGIQSQTEFIGWVSGEDKNNIFRQASIFCLPSYAEGFPMAVLDAWSYGLPVVTTPVGGIPDIAKDGENMLLFNPGDIKLLAEQLRKLILDTQLRDSISAKSFELSSGIFSQSEINKQLGEIYINLYKS